MGQWEEEQEMSQVIALPITDKPEDDVWECACGSLEFWVERSGFRCCNCETIANFGDVKFD